MILFFPTTANASLRMVSDTTTGCVWNK